MTEDAIDSVFADPVAYLAGFGIDATLVGDARAA